MALPRHRSQITQGAKKVSNIATWNLQGGLSEEHNRESLENFFLTSNVCIACLQETRMRGTDITYLPTRAGGLFINIPQKGKGNLGMGFYLSPEWVSNLESIEGVTDRIAVINLSIGAEGRRVSRLTIINVHQPSMAHSGTLRFLPTRFGFFVGLARPLATTKSPFHFL